MILSYVVPPVISVPATYTRFDHPSVSDAAIKTNPLFGTHDFEIATYPYCHEYIVLFAIPVKNLLAFGSVGIPFIHAAANCHE